MSEKFLAETKAIKVVTAPVNLNTGANTGNRVNMTNSKRCTFLFVVGAGTTTTAHTFNIKQYDAATAGNTYPLLSSNPYYYKLGSDTKFTRVDPTVDTGTFDLHALMADQGGIVIFEILSENIRQDCKWVSVEFPATGGAQQGVGIAFVGTEFGPAYTQSV